MWFEIELNSWIDDTYISYIKFKKYSKKKKILQIQWKVMKK